MTSLETEGLKSTAPWKSETSQLANCNYRAEGRNFFRLRVGHEYRRHVQEHDNSHSNLKSLINDINRRWAGPSSSAA